MLALKRLVTVAVVVYLLLALLFVFVPSVRLSVMSLGPGLSVLEQERQFFYVLAVIGAIIMALQLITENLDSVLLRRSVNKSEGKINELKARLYDQQQRGTTPSVPGSRTVDGRNLEPSGRPDHRPTPTFPQADPSLSNTPPADRPPLA